MEKDFDEVAEIEGGLPFLENQIESLFKRCGFTVKRKVAFDVGGVHDVVDFLVTTPADEKIIVDSRIVTSESDDTLNPILEQLVGKKRRLEVNKALLVTRTLKKEKAQEHHSASLSYVAEGVFYWDSSELNRIYSLKGAELFEEVRNTLKLLFVKKEKEPEVYLSDDFTRVGVKAAPQPFVWTWQMIVVGAVFVFIFFVFSVVVIWPALESAFASLENLFGLLLVLLFIVLLGLGDK